MCIRDRLKATPFKPEYAGQLNFYINVVAIDPAYKPAPIEHKQVYGITFEPVSYTHLNFLHRVSSLVNGRKSRPVSNVLYAPAKASPFRERWHGREMCIRDRGFAAAHIPLQQAVHGMLPAHIR